MHKYNKAWKVGAHGIHVETVLDQEAGRNDTVAWCLRSVHVDTFDQQVRSRFLNYMQQLHSGMSCAPVRFALHSSPVKKIRARDLLFVCQEQAPLLGNTARVLDVKSDNVCMAWFPSAMAWLKLPQQQTGITCFTHVNIV